jgi:hypothetical protein
MKNITAAILLLISLSGCGGSSSDSGSETPPLPQNQIPLAKAGADQNIATTTVVILNGTASSDADGDAITYAWSLTTVPAGSSASLSSSSDVSPTFTADIDGSYIAQLIVNDGTIDSTADTVTITAATANSAPTANAGEDFSTINGSIATLNGSGSGSGTDADADGDILSYQWSFSSVPTGSNAALSDISTSSPTFIADLDGEYIVQLIVNDGAISSSIDNVTLDSKAINPQVGEVVSAAVNPVNPLIILMSTKPTFIGESGTGIFRTEDGGLSWILVAEGKHPKLMKFSESDSNIIFTTQSDNEAGSNNVNSYGYSLDGGFFWNWESINEPIFGGTLTARTIDIDPSNSNEWWFTALNAIGGGFYRSLDSGSSWSLIFEGLTFRSNVAQSKSDPETVYFISGATASDDLTQAILKSTDNGRTRVSAIQGLAIDSVSTFGQFLLTDINDVLVTNNHISLDGGSTWTFQDGLFPNRMILENGTWYKLTQGLIQTSNDQGQNWQTIIENINVASLDSMPGASSFFTKTDEYFFVFSNGSLQKLRILQ